MNRRPPSLRPTAARHRWPLVLSGVLVAWAAACSPAPDDPAGEEAALLASCPGLAGQTIRWVVPYTPGGGYDVYSRIIEPHYERALGAEIVVENRTGAAGRIGARIVQDAPPDGRTMGIVNGSGLVIEGMLEPDVGLHPLDDFTALARVSVSHPVLMAGPASPYQNWAQIRDRTDSTPLVFGTAGVGGSSWVWAMLSAEVLSLNLVYVTGYPGTRQSSLALIRGDVDLAGMTWDSVRDRTESGDLRPVLQLTPHPHDSEPLLRDVPHVAGPDGVAAERARARGEDPAHRSAQAEALVRILAMGRLVVAPPRMDPVLASCLRDRLAQVLHDPAFVADMRRAKRELTYGDPAVLAAHLAETETDRDALRRYFLKHVDAIRSGGARR